MKNEFSTLLADVKEQILYLRELGAENLAVDLPEIGDSKFKIQNSKSEVSQQRLERFIPNDEILKKLLNTRRKPKRKKRKMRGAVCSNQPNYRVCRRCRNARQRS